ncbi:MAG: hypothetical protein K9J30_10925 [Bacteroidales bacterium]|nr:hypothetical protein [Bacteroidales bacterium]
MPAKRIGTAIILIEDSENINLLNAIISEHSGMILGRQGIPLREKGINIISLVLEGDTDEIGSLAGRIGRINGIRIKTMLAT